MAPVEVVEFAKAPLEPAFRAFQLTRPAVPSKSVIQALEIAGWVIGKDSPVTAIRCLHEGLPLRTFPVRETPAHLLKKYPDLPPDGKFGFWGTLGTLGLKPNAKIRVMAVMENNQTHPLGTLTVQHSCPPSGFEPSIQPLVLTSLGRTGTTWLMRLLSVTPGIVVHKVYPYENRPAAYWMHSLKVLTDPSDHRDSAHPLQFHTDTNWTGHNPFYFRHAEPKPNLEELTGLNRWFGQTFYKQLASSFQRSIESYYLQVAAEQNDPRPVYFAEKFPQRGPIPWITWGVYPRMKEIFLMRDPRDTLCSMIGFNNKRGFFSFGRENVNSDVEFVGKIRGNFEYFIENWRGREKISHRINYEDLIFKPIETLQALMDYLGMDRNPAVLEEVHKRASEPDGLLERHATAGSDPKKSIGRWRKDLTPAVREACEREFPGIVKELGYEL